MSSYFRQPFDPDAPSALRTALPTPKQVLGVFAGGAAGCGLRALTELWLPAHDGLPGGTLLVNLAGAFLLGLLLQTLLLHGDDSGTRRRLRLVLGTGLLGGFTTYSSLAIETVDLIRAGSTGLAGGYVVATVLGGVLMAWGGITAANRIWGRA